MKLRDYQEKAVIAAIETINSTKSKNGLLVLPTGTGKSHVIAEIVRRSELKTIILQPTKEILEQNLNKLRLSGIEDIGVFSASMGEKTVGQVTIATIGTIIKQKHRFSEYDLIIVDEAHLVNSKGGMYEEFISGLGKPVIGLTATPFRMKYYRNSYGNDEPVVESRFLTRTRPRIFNTIIHITQIPEMFQHGYLCPVEYDYENDYDSKKIRSNSTGQGYDENSLMRYNTEKNIPGQIIDNVILSEAQHILIFTHFMEESQQVIEGLMKRGIVCHEVSGQTKKKDRENILDDFKSGKIRCVVNVGVLTVGFDFPELDHIIIGRPTKSLSLFYQICGRGLRPANEKEKCIITDLCDNIKRFGEINSFEIYDYSDGNELWRLKSNIGNLTGVNLNNGDDLEQRQMATHREKEAAKTGDLTIPFGKHRGTKITDIDDGYMQWAVDNFDNGKWKTIFKNELARRAS